MKRSREEKNAWNRNYYLLHKEERLAYAKAYRAANPVALREKHLKYRFGMTTAQYDGLLAKQGGVCAICGNPPKANKRLAVDHNHSTGAVRGLLCVFDNRRLIGHLKETTLLPRLRKAIQYLENPPAKELNIIVTKPKRRSL